MNAPSLKSFSPPFALLILVVAGLSSCLRMEAGSLKLEANPPLSGGLGWAVVKEAYVRLKESPADASRDLDHLRRGVVFRLEGRQLGPGEATDRAPGATTVWYGIESEGVKGWVRETVLDVYQSQAQAEKAAAAYR